MMVDALAIMAERKISELPVIDADGRPAGLIDITDVVGLLPETLPAAPAAEPAAGSQPAPAAAAAPAAAEDAGDEDEDDDRSMRIPFKPRPPARQERR